MAVHGTCDKRFEVLSNLLQQNLESGEELGASIAVNIEGKDVVDIWGGYVDNSQTRPWQRDTIVNVFSTTKAISSLAILMLVDRGLLDVDESVSKYWPEFGVNGKEDIKVRHFLSHTSGISGWDDQMTIEDICDFEKSTAKLVQQSPWWTPGTASGYQVFTMGHLLGELVRRRAGKTLKQFVAEDIAGPLNADFQIGALEKDWERVANIVPFPPPTQAPMFEPNSIPAKSLTNPAGDANFANTPTWRQAELGASNGHGNAHAIARICSAITLGGKVDGIHLSQKTIDLIFKEQARGNDLVIGVPIRFGIGYGLVGDGDTFVDDWMPSGRVCFWGGWGGSLIIMDLDRRITISYVMNKMSNAALGSDLGKSYVKAVYAALKVA
jgi:CubicO group peptidase (beta-lactamase class C family)